MKTPADCPCGGGRYTTCCGRWHAGAPAPTAVDLMRSRYSAFVLGLADYLLATWHPDKRPATLNLNDSPAPKWIGLDVCAHAEDGDQASVEFVARYKVGGRAHRLHETSRFLRIDGKWFYFDGIIDET